MNGAFVPRGFGGAILQGGKLVRIAYLDEAGISNRSQEPYLVVAGIILHGDEQWRPLEERLRAIGKRYLPDDDRPIFHAMDIFHGNAKFDRTTWPRERRWSLLRELCEVPRELEIPVVFGFHHRQRYRDEILKQAPKLDTAATNIITHANTFVRAAIAIESWMRLSANRNESVMIIAEDTDKVKAMIKAIHSAYTNRFLPLGEGSKVFDSNHIIETVHFARKNESMPLQIADVCAFVIKRTLMEKEDALDFFSALRPQLVFHEEDNLWVSQSY
jgi:hypothetical protein